MSDNNTQEVERTEEVVEEVQEEVVRGGALGALGARGRSRGATKA